MKTLARKLAAALLVIAILAGSAPPAFADTDLEPGGTAVVAYTGGEMVKVRAGTGTDFGVLTSAPEGATVTIVAGPFASLDGSLWYGLSYDGTIGYIAADFLTTTANAPFIAAATVGSTATGAATSSGAATTGVTTTLAAGGTAVVAYTGGEMVKVRAGTGTDFGVLTSAPEGATVTIVAGPFASLDGSLWYGLSYDGTIGYIAADFLTTTANAPFIAAATTTSGASGGGASGGGGNYGSVITTNDGVGARMRDSAGSSAAIVTLIPENTPVQVVGSPHNSDGFAWYPISYNGYSGYVAGDFLGSGSVTASNVTQTAPRAMAALEAGAHVAVNNTGGWDLRLRASYNLDSDIVGHAAPDTVLSVQDGPFYDGAGNSWYAVDYDGASGYASASYLSWTSSGLSARQSLVAATVPAAPAAAPAVQAVSAPALAPAPAAPAPAPAAPATPAAPAASSHGQAMVSIAMRYLGYPYAWGGASPSGFDCSGFTAYVANLAFGAKLSHVVSGQIGAGTAVGSKDLQPGDLVFFVNTYEPGLSHVGIYIGGGQMIHAGSERTGVVISNIWDSYWGPKYYGARRL